MAIPGRSIPVAVAVDVTVDPSADVPTDDDRAFDGAGLRIGLVLGAGGAAGGAFTRAALQELEHRTAFRADQAVTIVGTSTGAFTAAALGQRRGVVDDAVASLAACANGHDWRQRIGDLPAAVIRRLGGRLAARVAPRRGRSGRWSVAGPPYHDGAVVVTATKPWGRRSVHRLAGCPDPRQSVLASAAIPFVTAPVEIGDHLHVDGAVHSPTNADLVAPDAHDILVVVAPMVLPTGGNGLQRLHRSLLRRELRPWSSSGKPFIVITPTADERRRKLDPADIRRAGTRAVQALPA